MPNRVCLIDIPGLSRELLAAVPAQSELGKWIGQKHIRGLTPSFPAVTCSVQATLTTGQPPSKHGIISNGMPTFRFPEDQALVDANNFAGYRKQISFWEQSNQFLDAPRMWQNPDGSSRWKTALLFFQHSMPGFSGKLKPAADIVLTPKPDHGPDGKLVSLCWSEPRELVPALFKQLGPFPLMNYWGPMAGFASSQWIAKAAAIVWREHQPQLQWTYIPHLDYDLQRFGPSSPQAKQAVADMASALDPLISSILETGGKLVVISEYAMHDVTSFVQPNQILAAAKLLLTKSTPDGNLIDYERSAAFAMVDHQVAHIYCKDGAAKDAALKVLNVSGVESISEPIKEIAHRRAGDLIAISREDCWFDYRWWANESEAPSFAKMVDIHRKPGYDPLELFWDPATKGTWQNPGRIKGSHGRVTAGEALLIADDNLGENQPIAAHAVAAVIQRMLG
jgi:predicted AlkP superfamily pyrophosphatase or phosphodiesterase